MGIYIKGMKMPKDDEVIRFVKLLNGKIVAVKEKIKSFGDMYDIVEVAEPHGRFVDESKIHTGIRMEKNTEYRYFIDKVNAPTVIEAEGE